MEYTIGEFSALTNLRIHTLRYYEKENGRRLYSENDVNWIQFIMRLKDTGMPIKEIQKYAAFRATGNATLTERMEMLIKHRKVLNEEIMKLQEHLEKLDSKIDYYRVEVEKNAQADNFR